MHWVLVLFQILADFIFLWLSFYTKLFYVETARPVLALNKLTKLLPPRDQKIRNKVIKFKNSLYGVFIKPGVSSAIYFMFRLVIVTLFVCNNWYVTLKLLACKNEV